MLKPSTLSASPHFHATRMIGCATDTIQSSVVQTIFFAGAVFGYHVKTMMVLPTETEE